jgi:5-bromo-4-chloroindolyl phosphate hydrolysis protein
MRNLLQTGAGSIANVMLCLVFLLLSYNSGFAITFRRGTADNWMNGLPEGEHQRLTAHEKSDWDAS